ncbi:hypothetical protein EVAR_61539_1 [Eumeta japonica]|uniref:Uncharacterized protein n=1 Tax=Eumeta variegata TaxID=151549 RepID=A0A4C1YUM2_EUMVA|nr:hypothetical protein EVAR_61539_1 [Eumeta japonica]
MAEEKWQKDQCSGDAISAYCMWTVSETHRNINVRERCGLKQDVVIKVERAWWNWWPINLFMDRIDIFAVPHCSGSVKEFASPQSVGCDRRPLARNPREVTCAKLLSRNIIFGVRKGKELMKMEVSHWNSHSQDE